MGGYSGIHVDNDISNEIDEYRFTGGGYSVMPVGINIGSESDGYRLTLGGYSGDTGGYRYL